jgi:metallo-beta-lactamase class B
VCYDIEKVRVAGARNVRNVEPFEIMNGLYYVGNTQVSSHLLTTDNGLILIDTPMPHAIPMLLESIRKLGFDPRDVKVVAGLHPAVDHSGGTWFFQQAFGAEAWLHELDVQEALSADCVDGEMVDLSKTRLYRAYPPFKPDRLIKSGETIEWGGRTLVFHHTPISTPGTMTLEIPLRGPSGTIFRAALVGGVADRTGGMANSLAVLRGLEDIDVWLAVHPSQNNTLEKGRRLAAGERPNPFIDPQGWSLFLDKLASMDERGGRNSQRNSRRKAEGGGIVAGHRAEALFKRLDVDGNGIISGIETQGRHGQRFTNMYDKNGDGVVTMEEVANRP